jgi:hypothetical protein
MTGRSIWILALLACGVAPTINAQADGSGQRDSFRRAVVHNGKWLTAASVAALIMFAEREHTNSQREWNSLLDICRSEQDACALGADGRYVRSDAEQFYQRSRVYDRRANRWLLGAQASLLATTALFIIDLHPGEGPENIPLAPLQVGLRLRF